MCPVLSAILSEEAIPCSLDFFWRRSCWQAWRRRFGEVVNRRLQQQQQGMNARIMDVQGTIEGVIRGGIIMAGNDSKVFRVIVPATANIRVTGTAEPDYLQSGMQLEFEGELDDQATLKEAVDKLAIVATDKQPGFFPARIERRARPVWRGGSGRGREAGRACQNPSARARPPPARTASSAS